MKANTSWIDGERWAPIREGHYAVSTHGRVMRTIGSSPAKCGVILATRTPNGFHEVALLGGTPGVRAGLKAASVRVHLLMAEAFLGECPEGFSVVHKDRNKLRNRIDNLEYRKDSK